MKKWILSSSIIVAAVIVGGALLVANVRHSRTSRLPAVTMAELKRNDGKNGHICFVAVDGVVYKIEGFPLWQNGVHTPSNGLAYCGADLSNVIDKAPHGRSILALLEKVGYLVP
jgi:predicted heme/steroid binding protein